MPKNDFYYLLHINDCIVKINKYTRGINQQEFLEDNLIQDAVIRNFEIIGEATKHLPQEFRSKYPMEEYGRYAG